MAAHNAMRPRPSRTRPPLPSLQYPLEPEGLTEIVQDIVRRLQRQGGDGQGRIGGGGAREYAAADHVQIGMVPGLLPPIEHRIARRGAHAVGADDVAGTVEGETVAFVLE